MKFVFIYDSTKFFVVLIGVENSNVIVALGDVFWLLISFLSLIGDVRRLRCLNISKRKEESSYFKVHYDI